MEITNTFDVAAPVEEVWNTLTDVEHVAPCLPGAQLTSTEGETYKGTVKVKVGPIRTQYSGSARFDELDESTRKITLAAEGRETRGQGTASATVTSELTPGTNGGTHVAVHTNLHLTGKVAQFGGDALSEVSDRLLTQFAHNLEEQVLAPGDKVAASEPGAAPLQAASDASTPPKAPAGSEKHGAELDLLETAGGVMARRAAPYAAVSALFLVIGWTLGRTCR